jgi:hypothetical protein
LSRCQQIVGELLSGLKDGQSELSRNVTAVYLYIFQTVTDILLKRESEKWDGVISVREEERETWRQAPAGAGGPGGDRSDRRNHRRRTTGHRTARRSTPRARFFGARANHYGWFLLRGLMQSVRFAACQIVIPG